MFTGLVEEVGTIKSVSPRGKGATVVVTANKVLEELKLGDSIAVSGACQTVIAFDNGGFTVEAVQETMRRTRFGSWRSGDPVNLERAMRPMDRLGGHLVSGHVDGLSEVLDIRQLDGSWRLRLALSAEGSPFVVEKGSVCLDGISLTIASRGENWFEVEIIPHTWSETTLCNLRKGDRIHVEWDQIAKYVQHMLKGYTSQQGGLTMEKLFQSGF